MKLLKPTRYLLTAALIFAIGALPAATQPASANTSYLLQTANTKLAVYKAMPDAQKIAIYDQISRFYVQQQKNSPYAAALADYLIPSKANDGDPIGYEVFLRYVDSIVSGKHAKDGVTGETAAVYGSIRHVGNSYLEELEQKAKNPKSGPTDH